MAPIMEDAIIVWANSSHSKDQLVITFSEELDTANITEEALFSFLFEGGEEYIVQYGDDFEWKDDGRTLVIYFG